MAITLKLSTVVCFEDKIYFQISIANWISTPECFTTIKLPLGWHPFPVEFEYNVAAVFPLHVAFGVSLHVYLAG